MRYVVASVLLCAVPLAACKVRQNTAAVRDDGAPAEPAGDLNAELSKIAADLQGEVTIIAQGPVAGRDAVALDDDRNPGTIR